MEIESAHIHVNPDRLLRVTYIDAAGNEQSVVALVCHYTAVNEKIAVEVLFDPIEPEPSAVYQCPRERIEQIVLSPKKVNGDWRKTAESTTSPPAHTP